MQLSNHSLRQTAEESSSQCLAPTQLVPRQSIFASRTTDALAEDNRGKKRQELGKYWIAVAKHAQYVIYKSLFFVTRQ